MAAEPSSLGVRVRFWPHQTPSEERIPFHLEDLADLTPPDPTSDGFCPLILHRYASMKQRVFDAGYTIPVVAARGRIEFTHPGVRDPARVREYTRSIPPSWKPVILEKYGHRCFLCSADLKKVGFHIDHWIPFSRGGTSEMSNLRPLCGPCNLKKGNREAKTG